MLNFLWICPVEDCWEMLSADSAKGIQELSERHNAFMHTAPTCHHP